MDGEVNYQTPDGNYAFTISDARFIESRELALDEVVRLFAISPEQISNCEFSR